MASCILTDIAKECADAPRTRVKTLDEAQRVSALLSTGDDAGQSIATPTSVFRYGPSTPSVLNCFYCSSPVTINKHTVRGAIRKLTVHPAYHVSICPTCCDILNQ